MAVKYTKNESYFDIPTKENSYWAGFIAADGNVNVDRGRYRLAISLNKKDKSQLTAFANSVQYNGPIRDHIAFWTYKGIRHKTDASTLCINNAKKWFDPLETNFNITPQKSLTLQPPSLSSDLRLYFIRGYFDGDGCVYLDKNQWRYEFLGTPEMLHWIAHELNSLLGKLYIPHKTQGKHWVLKVGGARGSQLVEIFQNLPTHCLSRKNPVL